jgi:uncharacterized protein YlxW (UPF0749 family)
MNRRLVSALALSSLLALTALRSSAPARAGEEGDAPPDRRALEERLARAEVLAGLTQVEGPGLIVHLRNSPKEPPKGQDPKGLRVSDQDFNAVLNALRVAGAEAMGVNGQGGPTFERVLLNTAARGLGSGIVLNGIAVQPPYQIHAIGDAFRMKTELLRVDGVVKKTGLDVLQMIEIQEAATIRLPAARDQEIRYARAIGTNGEPPVQSSKRVVEAPAIPASVVRTTTPPVVKPAGPAPGTISEIVRRPLPQTVPKKPGVQPTVAPAPMTQVLVPAEVVVPKVQPKTAIKPKPTVEPAKPESTKLEPIKTVLAVGAVFGGKSLAKYHKPGCRYGERIEAPQRIRFSSAEEAKGKGRSACLICHPEVASR